MSGALILLGAIFEAAGFLLATLVIREIRGDPFWIEVWAGRIWKRLRFMPAPVTNTVLHGADLIAMRDTVVVVKTPAWDQMDTDSRFNWLLTQQKESQQRLNQLRTDLDNERALRDAEMKDLGHRLERDIHQVVRDSEIKGMSKEAISIGLFLAGLTFATIGNLL